MKDKWTVLNKDHCFFCSEKRVLDRAHIIPKVLFADLNLTVELDKILNRTLLMCPTHHRCFDSNRLFDIERKQIKPYIDEALQSVNVLYSTFLEAKAEIPRHLESQYKKRDTRFNTFFRKLSEN